MPELPEVHTIVTDLKKHLVGWRVVDVEVVSGNYISGEELERLVGQEIIDVERVAKNIVIGFESGENLVIHLVMTGRLLLRSPSFREDPYTKLVFVFEKGDKRVHLRFTDKRGWGKVFLVAKGELEEFSGKYGPDLLTADLTPKKFLEALQKKRTKIKGALLDQKIVSGLGNAYATDALWIAGIHPEISTRELDLEMAEKLLSAIREILEEGITNRGISMADYVDLFGKKGKQQEFFRVYKQEVCPKCGGVVVFKKVSGRGTYFCVTCQLHKSKLLRPKG